MTKKLKIVGPYTTEHKGPFCTRNKRPVEIVLRQGRGGKIWGYMGYDTELTSWEEDGQFDRAWERGTSWDLMNAEEIEEADQPREFWVNEYLWGMGTLRDSCQDAIQSKDAFGYIRTIHVREVLPGEGE